MRRPSALDQMVRNFQHRWETNPQFRATWSGALGLALIVSMCACLGIALTFSSSIASRLGGSSANGSAVTFSNYGSDTSPNFPTATIPPWTNQNQPADAPIPPSTTAAPTPTLLPTATDVPTAPPNPGGGGGGGGGGGNVTITGTNPSPLKGGGTGYVLVHSSQPNANVELNINWPNGAHDFPAGFVKTGGDGNGSVAVTVPGGCSGSGQVMISSDISGGGGGSVSCTP